MLHLGWLVRWLAALFILLKRWHFICRFTVRLLSVVSSFRVAPNGPAIKGGCVTRRSTRAGSWYFSREVVTVQGGYGALFAVQVQFLLSITHVAVQVLSELRIYPRLQSWWLTLAQCRGTICHEARNLSRYRI